ncbi:PEGA domain protein [Anaerohalosphaera lusitana]|uniref:PEGA domain protein n=1 Tax=Anaerohalosphaera lusitana TaxID=1936003 RepID=A0A1U9NM74_9BACT|nr:PEGA domain-containing protein [Anaerohalosphaera lusitana]AQT68690.1 PEGA domain protein [Anaerohalosphaera lusitana]
MSARNTFTKSLFAMLVTAAPLLTGCIERKLTINTKPQGALVTLNDEQVGKSPVTVDFNWYGDYKVHIAREGYTTLDTHRVLEAPTHDKFPFDFFYGVLWPETIVDEYEWTFELEPYQVPDRNLLIESALDARQEALGSTFKNRTDTTK